MREKEKKEKPPQSGRLQPSRKRVITAVDGFCFLVYRWGKDPEGSITFAGAGYQ